MDRNSIIVYASCGEGHKIAASALSDEFNSPSVDILDLTFPFIKKFYTSGYTFTVRYLSFIWKLIFLIAKSKPVIMFINRLNFLLFVHFYEFLSTKSPKFIIVTHFFPIYIVKIFKKTFNTTLIVIVTDIGVHPFWVDECVDYYFVAMDRTKGELKNLGVKENRIITGGIPLRAGFKRKTDTLRIRKKIGLDSKETILLFSSAAGRLFIEGVLKEFTDKFNFIVIYGQDNRLKSFLDRNKNLSVKYFPYYSDIWELMDISSFIVTKPGGLTVFECLYTRKPMIFTHFIWGQEKVNMEAAIKLGAGAYVPYYKNLLKAVDTFKNSSAFSRLNFDDSNTMSVLKSIIQDNG